MVIALCYKMRIQKLYVYMCGHAHAKRGHAWKDTQKVGPYQEPVPASTLILGVQSLKLRNWFSVLLCFILFVSQLVTGFPF